MDRKRIVKEQLAHWYSVRYMEWVQLVDTPATLKPLMRDHSVMALIEARIAALKAELALLEK